VQPDAAGLRGMPVSFEVSRGSKLVAELDVQFANVEREIYAGICGWKRSPATHALRRAHFSTHLAARFQKRLNFASGTPHGPRAEPYPNLGLPSRT